MRSGEARRRSLHRVAELLMAGPQYRASGRIRLRVTSGGFATAFRPDVRLEGEKLVAGGRETALSGTYADVARAAGIDAGAPEGAYRDLSGVRQEAEIELNPGALREILAAFVTGDAALRAFAPGETPVLWPEHFDVAITTGEVNYGLSPGDAFLPEPYVYVGPHTPRTGPFWNAPFGAVKPLRGLADVAAFFTEGQAAARS